MPERKVFPDCAIIWTVNRVASVSIALSLFGLASTVAAARTAQPWPDILISAPVAKGWLLSGEAIGRVADDSRPSQIETRTQIGHVLSKSVTAWIGWIHIANYNPHAANGREDQVVEQVNWKFRSVGRVLLFTRTRLEQRFIRDMSGTSWRWRQQLRGTYALGSLRAPSAIAWVEPFIALNRTAVQSHTLEQLRSFVGVNVPISPHSDLELGYLNQRIYRANTTIVNDAFPVILTVRF